MSDAAPAMIGPLRKAKTADGAAFVGLVVAMFLLFWGGNLAGNGVLPLPTGCRPRRCRAGRAAV